MFPSDEPEPVYIDALVAAELGIPKSKQLKFHESFKVIRELAKTYFDKLKLDIDNEVVTRVINGEPDPAYKPVKMRRKEFQVVKFVLDNPDCEFEEIRRSGIWESKKINTPSERPTERTVTVTISSTKKKLLGKLDLSFDGNKRNDCYRIHL